jgi:hypothetical protein
LADQAQYLSGWIIFDFGNWTLATGLKVGDFWENLEIFGFSNFHRSDLLDKRLAIGRILGNWEGLLVNWKIQNTNPIGNWTLEH